MKLKKIAAAVLTVAMMFSMTGCNAITIDGEENVATGEGESVGNGSIGFSVSTLNNPFFVTLSEGAKDKADELGVNLIVVDAGDETAKQTSDIEDLISRNISVLIVNPVDSDAVAPAVKDAVSKGIKVISVDRVVNGVDVDCAIASDNVAGAEAATEYLVSLIGEGAKVAELQGTTGASATIDRGQGFHNVADKKLNVVASQTGDFNRSDGMSVMENMLQADSGIQGVFAHNDEMALGAVEAIGSRKIVVVGFDATDDAQAAVKAGKMAATVAQKPDLMGATAVETAQKILNGETVDKEIPVEVELITK
ncbi:D-ribose ABC transporter substrate-binding protein [Dorea formicigenerans]